MDRRPTHILLLKAARALELTIAAVILVVIVCGLIGVVRTMAEKRRAGK